MIRNPRQSARTVAPPRGTSLGILVVVALALSACRTAPPPAPAGPPSFATAMQRHAPLGTVPGGVSDPFPAAPDTAAEFAAARAYAEATGSYALLIWHEGRLRAETYFAPHDASLRAESASMHKTVLALAVGAAIDDGLIESADAPAARWIDEWRNDERRDIRLRHLLTMSSGLRALSLEGGAESERARFFTDGPSARTIALSLPATSAPGSTFRYANTDSQLLGLVLEKASGMAYADYLSQRLWQRIGADTAYVWFNEAVGFPRTYTALMARPRDWLRIGLLIKDRGILNGQQILSSQRIDELTAPSARNPGYGWQVWRGVDRVGLRYYNETSTGLAVAQSEPFAVDDLIFLDGYGGQRVYVSRQHDLVIVRLGDARADWDDAILPNRVIEAIGPNGTSSP